MPHSLCYQAVFLATGCLPVYGYTDALEQDGGFATHTLALVGAITVSLMVLIFILTLCGGCAPMEVGSESHAASSGNKTRHSQQYSATTTDANTRIMTSGTSLANDPYNPDGQQQLPYSSQPQTALTFTGYQARDPPRPGSQGHTQYTGGYLANGSGAHRAVFNSEPPPPSYSESVGVPQTDHRPSAPPQQYGW